MTETTLKVLTAKKETLFRRVQNLYDCSKKIADKKQLEIFKIRYESLEETRQSFDEIISRINELQLALDPDANPSFAALDAMDDMYCYIRKVAKEVFKVKTEPTTATSIHATQNSALKLPKIELPCFSGVLLEWPVFYETFKSLIHDNAGLDPINKLHYLLGKLSGKALNVCSGVTPTAENYDIIWKALVEKYEDKRALANCYMDQIISFKPAHTENVNCLNAFLERFDPAVKALKNLNIPDLMDFMLSYLALAKMDKETVKIFEMSRRKKDQPTYQEVVEFIREQSKILSFNAEKVSKPNTGNSSKQKPSTASTTQTRTFLATESSNKTPTCILCNNAHALFACDTFLKLTPKERYNYTKEKKLCFNCLSSIHKISDCKSKNTCRTCSLRHHSLLHWSKFPEPQENYANKVTESQKVELVDVTPTSSFCSTIHGENFTVLLSTARVLLILPDGKAQVIRVLIDNASQSNFLTSKCCAKLKLPVNQCSFSVTGIGSVPQKISGSLNLVIASRFNVNVRYALTAFIVEKITGKMPSCQVNTSSFDFLEGISIADDNFSKPGEIDGILGAEIFAQIIGTKKLSSRTGFLHALETSLGYVVTGKVPMLNTRHDTQAFCSFIESFDDIMKKFWEVEEVETTSTLNQEEEECEQFFSSTYTRDQTGRYTVRLPFKRNPEILGDSFTTASRRFYSLEKHFKSSPDFKSNYCDAMEEQINSGYLSPVFEDSSPRPAYYIPHHGVFKPDSVSTPLRIVLDASAKTSSGYSLNDILHKGPKLQTDLVTVLLNFRLFEIAVTADLRRMFFQIILAPEDRKFQRLLWRSSSDEPVSVFQLDRVAFGLKSSPYLALRIIRQLAADESERYPDASKIILRDTYVDDLVSSFSSLEEAKQMYVALIQLFKAGGFTLTKWCSNSQNLLEIVPEENRLTNNLEFEDNSSKVLGLEWQPANDSFGFKLQIPENSCTKRNILSAVARIYDPLGLLAPIIFYVKLLIRELWNLTLGWDDDPPSRLKQMWLRFYEELHLMRNFRVSRYLFVTEKANITLLGFADASEKGYGALVFMRVVLPNGEIKTSLVCAKSKVAPLKIISIPRLELCASLLLAKLLNLIMRTFNSRIEIRNVYAFTDSKIVLHWIHGLPTRWKLFVANRVSKIQSILPPLHWFHINGINNPADCLSRGMSPSQFINHSTWLHGPEWLSADETCWPITAFVDDPALISDEEKKIKICMVATHSEENVLLSLIHRVSNWNRLLNIMVFVLRFCRKLPIGRSISTSELDYAELILIRLVQRSRFADAFDSIENKDRIPTSLIHLRPFIDSDGLLRVGGRLSNSNLNFDQQHPLLLPKSHALVNGLIDYYHQKYLHAGPHLLLSLLRQKYWILSARAIVRKRVHACNACFKTKPRQTFPLMADLPSPRVMEAKAFCHTGVDYGGPFFITLSRRRGVKSQKAYICLFVCLTTHALHLEVASDLSTDTFLDAFKRFLSRRGPCAIMYSDMGTNFQGAKRNLDEVYQFVQSSDFTASLKRELIENRIKWKFNPPSAPHFGGIWEAGIKSVKSHLARVIGTQILTYEEFATVLTQIECILNTRPLCWLSCDPSEPLTLTPAHFLTLTPLRHLPATDMSTISISRLGRKELLDQIVQSYWKRWSLEYLNNLQSRQKWNSPSCPVKPGTLVIIRQNDTPPLHWPLGVVQEVFPGKDNIVRVVSVKTKDGVYKRPVVKLCPLPTQ